MRALHVPEGCPGLMAGPHGSILIRDICIEDASATCNILQGVEQELMSS
jgi:hypothetical protein